MKKRKPAYLPYGALKKYRESNTPDRCPILGHEEFDPVVDHNHKTGNVRGVVSRQGNSLIGKAENFFQRRCGCAAISLPEALRKAADYLEKEDEPVLHPKGLSQLCRRFKASAKSDQIKTLRAFGVILTEIEAAKSAAARTKLYRKVLTEHGYGKSSK